MSKAAHLTAGQGAEEYALKLLQKNGLRPVTRNYRCKQGELDLVMLDGEQLVIVEVRFRASRHFGHAAETVNRGKQGRIITATKLFLSQNPQHAGRAVRFDVVALHGDAEPEWLKDAFQTF